LGGQALGIGRFDSIDQLGTQLFDLFMILC
jgi:hypothetical protein